MILAREGEDVVHERVVGVKRGVEACDGQRLRKCGAGGAHAGKIVRLMERRKDLRGRVRLMHVSVSANRAMTAYETVQNDIEQIAGRINSRFGTFEWQPVALIGNAIPFKDLIAYYQAADICWITPLADGLHLVAKEFCAARAAGDGVLVLSEFAGVAVELSESVLANPFSNRSMDSAIDQGLDMEEAERRSRMAALRRKVSAYDIRAWAEECPEEWAEECPEEWEEECEEESWEERG